MDKLWSKEKFPNLAKKTIVSYGTTHKHLEKILDIPIRDLKRLHLQQCIDKCLSGYTTKKNIRVLLHQLFDYTIQNDIADKNYAESLNIGEHTTVIKRTVFSPEEIQKLWDNIDQMDYIDSILILLYSGMRVGELFHIHQLSAEKMEADHGAA